VTKLKEEKFYLESKIEILEETDELRQEVSSVIKLPDEKDRQIDLQYFSAVFVSSGENLNHAFFLPSELVVAKDTIAAKALDVEHEENEIIGHLYDYAFTDKDGKHVEVKELASKETSDLDKEDVHIVVAGVIYKNRFPSIADEVASGKWKVSMECYYQGYDVKVGDLIISKKEAEMLGFASDKDKDFFGRAAKVIKQGIEIAEGTVTRVLRNICFSGCGIVKNPANPPSVILETASEQQAKEVLILDYDKAENKVTSTNIEDDNNKGKGDKEMAEGDDVDSTFKGPNTNVLHQNWCALFETACTSFSRDTTDPNCLRTKARSEAKVCVDRFMKSRAEKDKRSGLVKDIQGLLKKAKRLI
jgi:hypothetical protein